MQADNEIYLMDTLGEMGLAYRLADIAFIGGTLVPHGGQNPFEAAQLNCAILHGPHIVNFEILFDDLAARGWTCSCLVVFGTFPRRHNDECRVQYDPS